MSLITPEQTRAWYEGRGRALGEHDDSTDHCAECHDPTLADEMVNLDGQDVCVPCLVRLTGDDPYAPDHNREL